MNTRPALLRSIPFWILVAVSLITIAFGWWIMTTKLAAMTATLTDGSATAVDVYVGPSIALLGAVLIGVGAIGILLALGVAAAASLRPKTLAVVEVIEPVEWTDEESVETFAAQEVPAAPVAAEPAPLVAEPAVAEAAPVTAPAAAEPAGEATGR